MSPAEDRQRPDDAPRLWTPSFWAAVVAMFGVSMVFITTMTYMALYAVERFGVQDAVAGFAASSFILGAALVRIVSGKYLDFIGRKRLLLIALIVFLACCLVYPLTWDFTSLVGLRLLHGMAFGGAGTALTASVVDLVPRARRSEGVGYFGAASTISTALGPLAAVQLSGMFGADAVFWFISGASLVALGAVLLGRFPERTPTPEEHARRFRLSLSDVLDPDALPAALVLFLAASGYAGVVTFLNTALLERGMVTAASLFFVAYAAGMLLVRLFAGRIQDTRGDNTVMLPLFALFILSLVMLAVAEHTWVVLAAGVLGGIGFGGITPALQVIGVTRARPERLGIATSTHYMMLDLGVAIGPVVFGLLIPLVGYTGMYLALAVTGTLAVVLYWLVHGRAASPGHRPS